MDSNGAHLHSFGGGLLDDTNDIIDTLKNTTFGFLYKFWPTFVLSLI